MKLFVDDIRACPEGWIPAKTVTEAIRFLATQPITVVSLDHDIGCRLVNGHEHSSNETFEPVARYIALMPDERLPHVLIHTANLEAGRRMAEIIGIPYENKIFDPEDYKC